jgi:hypothetical protein
MFEQDVASAHSQISQVAWPDPARWQKALVSSNDHHDDSLWSTKTLRVEAIDPFAHIFALLPGSEPIKSAFRELQTKPMLDPDLGGVRAPVGIPVMPSGELP